MRFGPADRDIELRRVSRLTRWLIAGTVGLVGVLSALVAQALPGSSASSTPGSATASPPASSTPSPTAPTLGPSVTEPSGGGSNLTPSAPPVPTRHRSVTRSGGS
jgi:hypothetical protein